MKMILRIGKQGQVLSSDRVDPMSNELREVLAGATREGAEIVTTITFPSGVARKDLGLEVNKWLSQMVPESASVSWIPEEPVAIPEFIEPCDVPQEVLAKAGLSARQFNSLDSELTMFTEVALMEDVQRRTRLMGAHRIEYVHHLAGKTPISLQKIGFEPSDIELFGGWLGHLGLTFGMDEQISHVKNWLLE